MKVFEADESFRGELNQFYRELGYHSGWSRSERAFIATNDDEIVGSVKVEVVNGFSVLRGMYVAKGYQGNGCGTEFLKHIEPILNETISYCMPFSHLGKFYGQIGFQPVNPDSFPEYLAQRYRGYEEKGFQIIAMRREQAI
ncbi:GNAT family N-acetyltransferase [Photobacterium alginatilyticum]|uniref:GNAT family N-acetyltransferase n=1 Tax=Photobacterium alginatilyticum TaxID=1775171 RepID=UPI004068F7BC